MPAAATRMDDTPDHTPDDFADRLKAAADLLAEVARNRDLLARVPDAERERLLSAAGEVSRPDARARRQLVKERRRQRKAERIGRAESALSETGIRKLRRQAVYTTPNVHPPAGFDGGQPDDPYAFDGPDEAAAGGAEAFRVAPETRNCYICKRDFDRLHHFYDQLCPACAEFNFRKRTETADLRGRVALLTGGRVKIGYQAGIKLLRAGCRLVVSTRFPRDAAMRYAAEPDFAAWGDRLQIYGLDLRHTPSVEAFCAHLLGTLDRLDFIVNNACQTVRRPPAFYEHMMGRELGALQDLPDQARRLLGAYEGLRGYHLLTRGGEADPASRPLSAPGAPAAALAGLAHAAAFAQVPLLSGEEKIDRSLFPEGRLDQDLQQVDLRGHNSWRMLLAEVPTVELLEVHLVNAVAPFLLNARLKPLMLRTPGREKHIVNVSAVEGQFYRKFKTTRHPHTNMAKAALNMMTRTAAADYHADGIHMNAVDTGWVTDEDPAPIAERKTREHRFHPPLDIVDGAARIVDPILDGVNTGVHVWGKFLKDYRPVDW